MQRIEHRFTAMGGPCHFSLDHPDGDQATIAIQAAESEVRRLEQKYSRYLQESVTSELNRAAGGGTASPIDPETFGILQYADTLWRESDGLFDLTSGILRRAWDFKGQHLPSEEQLAQLLPLIGWDKVQWDEESAYLPQPGMELDFGGCVKEYASDSAANILRENGIAQALVNLAGDITAVGRPHLLEAWSIGIQHPQQSDGAIAEVTLHNAALASSGDYQRCLEINGRRYGHILNPKTGWPSAGLVAVSIIAEQCLVAGSSATIAMLKPEADALTWLSELGLPWLAIDAQLRCHGSLAE